MTNIIQSIKKELKEWYQVATAKRSGEIAKELWDEFYKELEE